MAIFLQQPPILINQLSSIKLELKKSVSTTYFKLRKQKDTAMSEDVLNLNLYSSNR